MARPTVGTLTEEVNSQVQPVTHEEDERDYPQLTYLEAILARAQEIADLARDSDDGPGWSSIVDPDRAPAKWLPWTAQIVGAVIPPPGSPEFSGLTEEAQRLRVKSGDGQRRGSVGAMRTAARQRLIGPSGGPEDATVYFFERHGGDAYDLTIGTLDSETPDPDLVEADLIAQKPAGIVLTYVVVGGGTYADLEATHASYTEVAGDFTDYQEVLTDPTNT